ncbi:MAG: hypothetical protein DHS20C05_22460 [Hyphococcus sp.]|nr:MAG: hypothetical protein DHS20C05_22460 [Marinicaulis sp.]
MTRILLPLAIVAAIFFGPMFSETTSGAATGDRVSTISGEYFIGEAIGCLRNLTVPLGEECASDGMLNESNMVGKAMSWASMLAIGAAGLGIIGLLPFIGRITSIVTVVAGLGSIAAIGYMALTLMATDGLGLPSMQWGAYLAAAAGLLTTISGLAGMRGR